MKDTYFPAGGFGRILGEISAPVVITHLTAMSTPEGVDISWQTRAEESPSFFELFRASASGAERGWTRVPGEPVRMNGAYRMHDGAAPDGVRVDYRLVSIDRDGFRDNAGEVSLVVDIRPATLLLAPAPPNPFRTGTGFAVEIPRASRVRVRLLDMTGRLVRSLAEELPLSGGRHTFEWDGRTELGLSAPPGSYYLWVASEGDWATTRLVKVK